MPNAHCIPPRHLRESALELATRQRLAEMAFRLHEPCITLEIGTACESLRALHQERGTTCSALITFDTPECAARREQLLAELGKRKLAWIAGSPPHHGEAATHASVLILGLGCDGARDLGQRYAQCAVVWADEDAVPKLLLLR